MFILLTRMILFTNEKFVTLSYRHFRRLMNFLSNYQVLFGHPPKRTLRPAICCCCCLVVSCCSLDNHNETVTRATCRTPLSLTRAYILVLRGNDDSPFGYHYPLALSGPHQYHAGSRDVRFLQPVLNPPLSSLLL